MIWLTTRRAFQEHNSNERTALIWNRKRRKREYVQGFQRNGADVIISAIPCRWFWGRNKVIVLNIHSTGKEGGELTRAMLVFGGVLASLA